MSQDLAMISDTSMRGFTYQVVALEGIPKVCRMFIGCCRLFLGVAKSCRDLSRVVEICRKCVICDDW